MPTTRSADGLAISWQEWPDADPDGVPVLLAHAFVSTTKGTWADTRIIPALVDAGRRVVGVDARGHGRSECPHDPSFYGEATMARDLRAVADDLGCTAYDLVGYSMGAIVALHVAAADPRVRRLVVAGIGAAVVERGGIDDRVVPGELLVEALLTEDPSTLPLHVTGFRKLADANGSDRRALAAHASIRSDEPVALHAVTTPTLVIAGDTDPLAARPEVLADALADARVELVPGDHMKALTARRFRDLLVAELGRGA